jgi:hypothetical protein
MNASVLSRGKAQNYLYVEGSDDEGVFWHLLNRYNITNSERRGRFTANNEPFKIEKKEGIDRLLEDLKEMLKGDVADNRYGIVVDTDDNLETSWQRLRGVLEASGYHNIPIKPDLNGTILRQEELPIIGIWLMPDNKLPGMLEDFISFLGPQDDVL